MGRVILARMSSPRVLLASLSCTVLFAGSALAHDGPVEVTSLHARGTQERLLGTSFGVVHRADETSPWEVVCSEATGWNENVRGHFHLGLDGTFFIGSSHGLSVSRDRGCSWTELPELAATGVEDIRGHPTDPQRLYALSGKFSQANGVFRSDDGGATFPTALLQDDELYFSSLRFAPSDASRVWISAWYFAPERALLFRSDDGGETFTELDVFGSVPFSRFTLVAVHPDDPDVLFVQGQEQFQYHLLRSQDGGRTFDTVASDARAFRSVHFSEDGLTVWAAAERLHRSDDGGETFQRVENPLRAGCVGGFGPENGGAASTDDAFACGHMLQEGWALSRVDAEGGSVPSLFFREIEERQCPPGTQGFDVCRPLWTALAFALGRPDGVDPDGGMVLPDAGAGVDAGVTGGADAGKGDETPNGGCDCSSGGAALLWGAPLLVGFALRSRRRHA